MQSYNLKYAIPNPQEYARKSSTSISITYLPILVKIKKLRIFSQKNKALFKSSLTEISWDTIYKLPPSHVNKQWDLFLKIVLTHFNKCFPLVEKRKMTPKNNIIKSEATIKCKKELDILYMLREKNQSYSQIYNNKKKEYNKLLTENKQNVRKI